MLIHPRSGLYDALCYEGHLTEVGSTGFVENHAVSVGSAGVACCLALDHFTAVLSPFIVSRTLGFSGAFH